MKNGVKNVRKAFPPNKTSSESDNVATLHNRIIMFILKLYSEIHQNESKCKCFEGGFFRFCLCVGSRELQLRKMRACVRVRGERSLALKERLGTHGL